MEDLRPTVSETANKDRESLMPRLQALLNYLPKKLTKLNQKHMQCGRESAGPEDLCWSHGLSLTGCVSLDELLELSEPWFCHLLNGVKHFHLMG